MCVCVCAWSHTVGVCVWVMNTVSDPAALEPTWEASCNDIVCETFFSNICVLSWRLKVRNDFCHTHTPTPTPTPTPTVPSLQKITAVCAAQLSHHTGVNKPTSCPTSHINLHYGKATLTPNAWSPTVWSWYIRTDRTQITRYLQLACFRWNSSSRTKWGQI